MRSAAFPLRNLVNRKVKGIGILACLVLVLGMLGSALAQASGGSGGASSLSVNSFTSDFSAMAQLKGLAAKGSGKIGVLLPDTTSSARYANFDAPDFKQAFTAAGLSSDQFIITNAQGSPSTQLTQAQADISQGATVLIVDTLSSGVGASIESYAKARGVQTIDYDRLVLGGSADYYVSFNNIAVGKLIGQGFVKCIKAWNVKNPQVLVMRGPPTGVNAILFAQGYDSVLAPYFKSGQYTKVAEPAGTWDPARARTTFEEQLTAHPNINAVVMPNDDTSNAVISYLKTLNVPPKSFPTTGQDATLTGLQNVLSGYQCGTVYKPIYLEAQAAAALALYLRAGVQPPQSLVNATVEDTKTKVEVPSVLLHSIWVTPDNMAATVIKDNFVSASKLCAGMADKCKAAGISQ